MEKQGRITADRPHFTAAEIHTHGLSIGLLDAGEKFRRMRRALHTHLQPNSAEAYR